MYVGIITSSDESLFTYPFTKDWKSFYYPSFSPIYTISFSNSTLEKKAKEICRDDEFCLFDIAATGRVEIGEATVTDGQDFELLINLSKPSKNIIGSIYYFLKLNAIHPVLMVFVWPQMSVYVVKDIQEIHVTLQVDV